MIERQTRYKGYKIVAERWPITRGGDTVGHEWFVKVFSPKGKMLRFIEPIPNRKMKDREVRRVKGLIDKGLI